MVASEQHLSWNSQCTDRHCLLIMACVRFSCTVGLHFGYIVAMSPLAQDHLSLSVTDEQDMAQASNKHCAPCWQQLHCWQTVHCPW
jgi:hypothetical protein